MVILYEYIKYQKIRTGKFTINYSYTNDSYRQLEVISYYITTLPIEIKYTYETTINPNDNKTYYTGRIKELEYTNGENQIIKYVYEYDDYSNISKIYGYTNGVEVYYEENYYDIFNQLTAQWIEIGEEVIISEYGYDSRGNNIGYCSYNQTTGESLNSASFSYNDKDEMIQANLNGQNYNISYSSEGQPSLYLGWEIDYDMRNISVMENDDYYIEYYYNANGVRIGKSIDNGNLVESVTYILDGSNIIRETHTGASNYTMEYFYDSSDNIIGFTYNGNKYLYLKNLQNDIIGIVDSSNNIVVKYFYDAYGRIIKTLDSSGINLSDVNPFRYRSYYQDNETGWYYLNSRYYNPLTNRFITMDAIEYLGESNSVLSLNLYSYCENNPIMLYDQDGTDAKLILDYDEGGLLIVGHMALIVQDSSNKWRLIEFTGSNKSNAIVYVEEDEERFGKKQGFWKSLLATAGLGGWRSLYIKGDFTGSLEYAEAYEGDDYGGYNLFTNNCLHFVRNALKRGKCKNALLQLYFMSSTTIVPRIFFNNACVVSNLRATTLNKNRIMRGYYA